MIRFTAALFAVLFICAAASAQYAAGYVSPDGYTFGSDGYFHYGNNRYTFTKVYVAPYWKNNYYYTSSYYLSYTLVPTYTPPPAAPFDIKVALIDLRKAELQREYDLLKRQQDAAELSQLIKDLGLQGNPRAAQLVSPYYGGYAMSGYAYNVVAPVTATTIYGTSLKQLLDSVYGTDSTDLSAQLAAQTLNNADKAVGRHQQLVSDKQQQKAASADQVARHLFALEMVRVVNTPTSATTKGMSFRIDPSGIFAKDDSKVSTSDKAALQQKLGDLMSEKCSKCHLGATAKSNFDLNAFFTMSAVEKANRVFPRVMSTEANKRMPPPSEGPALTQAEIALFLSN